MKLYFDDNLSCECEALAATANIAVSSHGGSGDAQSYSLAVS